VLKVSIIGLHEPMRPIAKALSELCEFMETFHSRMIMSFIMR